MISKYSFERFFNFMQNQKKCSRSRSKTDEAKNYELKTKTKKWGREAIITIILTKVSDFRMIATEKLRRFSANGN